MNPELNCEAKRQSPIEKVRNYRLNCADDSLLREHMSCSMAKQTRTFMLAVVAMILHGATWEVPVPVMEYLELIKDESESRIFTRCFVPQMAPQDLESRKLDEHLHEERRAWNYLEKGKPGHFRQLSDIVWEEQFSAGGTIFFVETARVKEYVELLDASRNLKVRIFEDDVRLQVGDQGQWNRLGYSGTWSYSGLGSSALFKTISKWEFATQDVRGCFIKSVDHGWLEVDADRRVHKLSEVKSEASETELIDPARRLRVRLFDDHSIVEVAGGPETSVRSAGKWTVKNGANLMEGVPSSDKDYQIRLVYLVPADRQPVEDYEQRIQSLLLLVSEMLVKAMDTTNRGEPQFYLNVYSPGGNIVVHRVDAPLTAEAYSNDPAFEPEIHWQNLRGAIPATIGNLDEDLFIVFAETYREQPDPEGRWLGDIQLGKPGQRGGGLVVLSAWGLQSDFSATTPDDYHRLLFDMTPVGGRSARSHGALDSPRYVFVQDYVGDLLYEISILLGALPNKDQPDPLDILTTGRSELRWLMTTNPYKGIGFSVENAQRLQQSGFVQPRNW
jgi:hypothetical protein